MWFAPRNPGQANPLKSRRARALGCWTGTPEQHRGHWSIRRTFMRLSGKVHTLYHVSDLFNGYADPVARFNPMALGDIDVEPEGIGGILGRIL